MRKKHVLVFKMLMLAVFSCAVFFSSAGYSRAESPVTGVWQINANDYKGIMQIRHNSGEYRGQLKLESDGKWEEMLDLKINGSHISFRREIANQRYSGNINNDHMRGKFNQDGAGSYNWSAVKSSGGGEDSRGVIFAGTYTLVANNFSGVMQIRDNAGSYTGQMKFDDVGKWEQMLDLHINGTGISFRRANSNQRYKGTFKGGTISGVFNQDGKGSFQWQAEKR